MIAQLNIKKCPFRKKTKMVDWDNAGNYEINFPTNTIYEEDFMECLEEECLAWNELKHECHLMHK